MWASRGAGRAWAATAAPGKGGREPGPGLAVLRGETRQRDGLSAARASARSLVIQHPDFQTGGRGRTSSLAVPSLPVAREHAISAPRGPRGRAGPSPGPSPQRREPTPPDAQGAQAEADGARLRVSGGAQPLTTAAPLGRLGKSPSVRRARPGNFWPPPQRLGGESGTRAWDGERAEQGLPRK